VNYQRGGGLIQEEESKETWAKTYLPPAFAALVGSIISGMLSGSAAIFILGRTEASEHLKSEQDFGNRLIVVEAQVKALSDVNHDMFTLSNALTRNQTQMEDLHSELEVLRQQIGLDGIIKK
jgi:uncharacterized protein involved in exopolysaccharide biosynthesis